VKDVVIFDLDGTLALTEHRQHFLEAEPKDWRGFFAACKDDVPHEAVIKLLRGLQKTGFEVWIVSGRSDEVKKTTLDWLREHIGAWLVRVMLMGGRIVMRKEGDFTPDDELKKQWLNDGTLPKDRILCVFDDRNKVVKMWRDLGIPCMQVAEGAF
jgi:hydroxymethylpyrimidine pyrophosphatase-like HAD family hydrolase